MIKIIRHVIFQHQDLCRFFIGPILRSKRFEVKLQWLSTTFNKISDIWLDKCIILLPSNNMAETNTITNFIVSHSGNLSTLGSGCDKDSKTDEQEPYFGFQPIAVVTADGEIEIRKYRSKRTNILVYIADVEGPVVNGYFCLGTEAHDDDGLPHTLEHLIFMGSEDFPYKGTLDLMANYCLSSGTNAWTDTDHTCYTLTTAGAEGFLTLLPVYLDHILYPTLLESAYITEVHHVTGEGEDAGVVYCETQGTENTAESLCKLNLLRAMYLGNCGYGYETGGLMKNIREKTTHDRVKDYHDKYYRPDNLCIIVTGKVKPADLFKAILMIEKKILSKVYDEEGEHPWKKTIPSLTKSSNVIVPFPDDDEDSGIVMVGWRGPHVNHFEQLSAINVLLDYLTETSIAILEREFVEVSDPFCSSVNYSIIENFETCIYLTFENVPNSKLNSIRDKILGILKRFDDGTEIIDLERMKSVIHKKHQHLLRQVENDPHDMIAEKLITDFLYGTSLRDLQQRLCEIPLLNCLLTAKSDFWIQLIKDYFIKPPAVVVIGKPDPHLMKQMADEEKIRVLNQKKLLGKKGLQEKDKILKEAVKNNEIKLPDDALSKLPVPSLANIQFHSITCSNNYSADNAIKINEIIDTLPCRFQLDDVKTDFVQILVLMNTRSVSSELRLFLPILMELLVESPVLQNQELITWDKVMKELEADTVGWSSCSGLGGEANFFSGCYTQVAYLNLVVEINKYIQGVAWVQKLVYQTSFVPERIAVIAKKMINSIVDLKRDGSEVVAALINNMCFSSDSNHWADSMYRQYTFLKKILGQMISNPQQVVDSLNKLRHQLTNPENIIVHMTTSVKKLCEKNYSKVPWEHIFLPESSRKLCHNELEILHCHQTLNPLSSDLPLGAIIGVGAVESSYLILAVSSISSYSDPDIPALLLLIQYMTQSEGPFWQQIRGQGLAYHYSIDLQPADGLLYLIFQESTDIVKAYQAAKAVVNGYFSGSLNWDPLLLNSSKNSLMFEFIEKEKTVDSVSYQSMLSYFRGVDMMYNRKLMELVSQVSFSEMERVGKKYLIPLFASHESRLAICCHPHKVKEVVSEFKKIGREIAVIKNPEKSFLTQM